ncbi:hypothetical protein [Streptomyces natalensis]|uniref:Sigma-70 family RNA polymerase sigma factor n=1 Tax=Streptomyces natalensis ATCC 27448 TaxID=1240678 RepID=A0A0D7CHI0_9ACTN|nr:hypothetical protein [Streptomyces natalensis]KIZ15668.1 hypothetical protein SNA_25315 [Streptomyces natalensis ATCC 27448]
MDAVQPTLVTRLNAEWEWLCADRGNAERVRSWMLAAGVLDEDQAPTDLGDLSVLLRKRADRDGPEFSDAWMGVLLHRVSSGNGRDAEVAARVLVQAMLPCAVGMTRRSVRSGERPEDVAQLVIASLWEVVRSYPVARRPRQLARNLRMELWHRVSRDLKRELAVLAEPLDEVWACELPGGDDPSHAAEPTLLAQAAEKAGLQGAVDAVEELEGARGEVVALLVWALEEKVLTQEAAVEVCDFYREGAPQDAEAARVSGVSSVALRRRRSRAVARLRQAAPQWAEAA